MTEEWKCSGCGIESPDQRRSCDCITNVVFKTGNRHAWKLNAPEVEAIAQAIKLLESQGYAVTPRFGLSTLRPEERKEP
jgi:hypothetical protein